MSITAIYKNQASLHYRLYSIALSLWLIVFSGHQTAQITHHHHPHNYGKLFTHHRYGVVQQPDQVVFTTQTTQRCNQIPIGKLHHEDHPRVTAVSFPGANQTPAS